MPEIKERPILFSAPVVRAILEGWKTVTRRQVKGAGLKWLEEFTPEYVARANHQDRLGHHVGLEGHQCGGWT